MAVEHDYRIGISGRDQLHCLRQDATRKRRREKKDRRKGEEWMQKDSVVNCGTGRLLILRADKDTRTNAHWELRLVKHNGIDGGCVGE